MKYWKAFQRNPIKYIMGKLLLGLGISSLFRIRRHDTVLRFHPTTFSKALWLDKNLDPFEEEAFFRRYLKPGDVVVDVGANVGTLTCLAAVLVGSAGQVFAIEPHPRIFNYLRTNIPLNRLENVHVFNVALGTENGEVTFSNRRGDVKNSVTSEKKGIRVPLRRLDQLPLPQTPIQLLKIDVEGYEPLVLQGAAGILNRVECIYFECSTDYEEFGYRANDVLDFLSAHGFHVFSLREHHSLSPVSAQTYVLERRENLIAARDPEQLLLRTGYTLRGSDT